MPVNTHNPEYLEYLPCWTAVRDCIKGENAIKSKGETYLPKAAGHTKSDYIAYKGRVKFFGATGRTAEGLHGTIFSRIPLQIGEVPEIFQGFLDNVDGAGTDINQFASDLCWDTMQTGWGGVLADHAPVPEGISIAEKERLGLTAYLRYYTAESVINWRYDVINDKKALSLVVLQESYEDISKDEFAPAIDFRYRVLRLTNGIYTQQLYVRLPDKNEYAPLDIEPAVPLFEGKPLGFIPFFSCPGIAPEKSMLLDLAYENIGHYQKSADYENALHLSGSPTPYILGAEPAIDKDGNPADFYLGGSKIIWLPATGDITPSAGFLEIGGAGIQQMSQAIQLCETRMAVLGAKIISYEKKGIESAEAARIHRAGENSVMSSFAKNMSERLAAAVRFAARWSGIPESITEAWSYQIEIDTEGDSSMDAEKRLGLLEVESGLMSRERYLREFDGMSEEDVRQELDLIQGEAPEPAIPGHDLENQWA